VNEQEVFAYLQKQKKAVLLDYLRDAFRQMTAEQRRAVFADAVRKPLKAKIDADELREEIEQFRSDSLARYYYAPFNVNSKNFMHIPEKTHEWCDLFARFIAEASLLTARGDHAQAVACFAMLSELVEALDSGREIIFAEEAGSWMIPTDKKAWQKAYLTSLAATATPEAFTAAALPLLKRDSYQSFSGQVYPTALEVANPQQKAHLQAEVQRQKIRTGPTF
jgi:hypothetical protein